MSEALQHALNEPWRDPVLPIAERVADLMARMTVAEKISQLGSFWADSAAPGEQVAPAPDDLGDPPPLEGTLADGLGQLTRVFGTAPTTPANGAARLHELQKQVAAGNRFGIPAIAHEECLTGLMTWTATLFPTPLAWGATFDQDLVEEMAGAIGAMMRRLGVHQGLAPVLDVIQDYRWGRTEEAIGEDPQLVGMIGSAYARGLERAGIVATLKHFAGYASSRAGRNMAPAGLGPREFADIVLEPFAMALLEGGARAVMPSYSDVDRIPAHADVTLLTGLLRERLGFTGLVVADYYGISFLDSMHAIAGSQAEAAALALNAGVDVELPTTRCYGEPLTTLVESGEVPMELLDRSVRRVLTLKGELGLLDGAIPEPDDVVELDPPASRDLARRVAEESVVLLANDGILPLRTARVALAGPLADEPRALLGCYSFPNHMGTRHPGLSFGVEIPSLAEALRAELPELTVAAGTDVLVTDEDIAGAVAAARETDVCVLALGDRSGMFGRGTTTSGEGCDATSLELPGRQAELARAVLDTGTPTVIVLVTGRPYALGRIAERAAALVQAFFPGEEGATAIAGVLTGRVTPSGRLPVTMPRDADGQPGTYLQPPTGLSSQWSVVDPAPLFPFGHGLTWTTFDYSDLRVPSTASTDGTITVAATVRNTGEHAATEVVQLYLSDPVASVVRPVRWLAGWARVALEPGQAARVEFVVHADRTSFTGRDLRRIVEPGEIVISVGRSSADLPLRGSTMLRGPVRELDADRVLTVPVEVTPC
jgi:beta-glucosidase-like glycosyl hydrolase